MYREDCVHPCSRGGRCVALAPGTAPEELNQVPSAAPSCLSGKACGSMACGYGANQGAIRVHCAVGVQRTEPRVDAEHREELGWCFSSW